ncbi:MAG: hypothetical protein QOJ29_1817, partial [Thermoleophilaceae bacterium]|nr:hypothetical protein [Thermoleophilaceae bacterium]
MGMSSHWCTRMLSVAIVGSVLGLPAIQADARQFHKVSLARLLDRSTGTRNIGGTLFRYAFTGYFFGNCDTCASHNQPVRVMKRDRTSCRSITLAGGITG